MFRTSMSGFILKSLPAFVLFSLIGLQVPVYAQRKTFSSPVSMQYLLERKHQQEQSATKREAFYGFQFTNRIEESNIRFENRVVDDASKSYKAAHYDHGNGVAVADVDGDGLL